MAHLNKGLLLSASGLHLTTSLTTILQNFFSLKHLRDLWDGNCIQKLTTPQPMDIRTVLLQRCLPVPFKHKMAACLTCKQKSCWSWCQQRRPVRQIIILPLHCCGSLPRSLPLKAAALRWWAKHAISPKPRFTPCPASGWTLCAASLDKEKTEIYIPSWRKP